MNRNLLLLMVGVLASFVVGAAPRYPFPADLSYANCIRPSVSPEQMHRDVAAYYDYWKATYLKAHPYGGYYVRAERVYKGVSAVGNSEGHGYGMIAVVLMAGHDPDARKIFDGFLELYDKCPSGINPEVMAWLITEKEKPGFDNSALDGDMDVAYALLLAATQWRDSGGERYLKRAERLIRRGIEKSGILPGSYRLSPGDWSRDPWLSRPSDWCPGHMRAFQQVTKNQAWTQVLSACYKNLTGFQAAHSKKTGFISDFVVGKKIRPAPAHTVEGERDGRYSYNACRIPWRLATDFAHHGSVENITVIQPILKFAASATGGDPRKLVSEYELDGTPVVKYSSSTMLAPILAGCIVAPEHQAFLDKGWPIMMARKRAYYGDSITLLCSLLIAGDWWAPEIGSKIPAKKH